MAGRGPAPKPKSQRRRRNKTPEEKVLPPEGNSSSFPKLPAKYKTRVRTEDGPMSIDVTFLKSTRDWYDDWAKSPMATEFTGVDWQRLQRVARLVDQYDRNPAKDLLAEIRLQEASFGATPMDRRRLGLKIGDKPGAADPAASKRDELAVKRRERLAGAK